MADNSYHDCNVEPGGNIGHGAMGAVGECYHGSDPVWYSEFRRNSMVRSDGKCPRMHAKVGLHAA